MYATPTKQMQELAQTIANQAEAIANGKFTGPLYGIVRQMERNVEMLVAWTPDDRSN